MGPRSCWIVVSDSAECKQWRPVVCFSFAVPLYELAVDLSQVCQLVGLDC